MSYYCGDSSAHLLISWFTEVRNPPNTSSRPRERPPNSGPLPARIPWVRICPDHFQCDEFVSTSPQQSWIALKDSKSRASTAPWSILQPWLRCIASTNCSVALASPSATIFRCFFAASAAPSSLLPGPHHPSKEKTLRSNCNGFRGWRNIDVNHYQWSMHHSVHSHFNHQFINSPMGIVFTKPGLSPFSWLFPVPQPKPLTNHRVSQTKNVVSPETSSPSTYTFSGFLV